MNKHIFPRLNNIIHFHLLPTPSLCIYDSLSTLLHIHGSAIIKLYLQLDKDKGGGSRTPPLVPPLHVNSTELDFLPP